MTAINGSKCTLKIWPEFGIMANVAWNTLINKSMKDILTRPVDPVVEPVEPEYNPEPPAVPAMPVPRHCFKRSISLSQRQYIAELLERFSMDTANPVKVPIAPSTKQEDGTTDRGRSSTDAECALSQCSWIIAVLSHYDTP
ncbi:hypothetical protein H0H92_008191 [Tricholoma furcatifolium]|nr:hypothetical protein H0H92_008191 [Tricholoma furcatifolium]